MKQLALFLTVAAVLIAAADPGAAGEQSKHLPQVRIYFVGWDLLTRVPLGAEDVVRMRHVYVEINDSGLVENFVAWLRVPQMETRENSRALDARLVLEVVDREGAITVLYSDGEQLLTADSTRARPVDAEFRERFLVAHPTAR